MKGYLAGVLPPLALVILYGRAAAQEVPDAAEAAAGAAVEAVEEAVTETVAETVRGAVEPEDTVVLQDGTVVRGQIVEQQPGSHVTIDLPGGVRQTYPWSQVRSVSEARVDLSAGTVSHQSEVDCTVDPQNERCRERSAFEVGPAGAKFSYSKETLERVKTPPSFDLSSNVTAGLNLGTSLSDDFDASLFGFAITTGWRLLLGQLPGVEGGVFHGVGGEAQLGFSRSSMSSEGFDGSIITARAGGTLGYQYFSFETMNPDTLEQPGFGVFVGWQVGGQVSSTYDDDGDEIASDDGSLAHGPSISLSWPTYNAGTTDLTRWVVDGLALITEDFLFASVTFGYVF